VASGERRRSAIGRATRGRLRKRPLAYAAGALGIVLAIGVVQVEIDRRFPEPAEVHPSPERTLRAFAPDSWWNTRLPRHAPAHPAGKQILHYLRTGPGSGPGCLLLSGTADTRWGTPIFWAKPTDPEYDFEELGWRLPPELDEMRMPTDARPAVDGSGTMTVYDVDKGYVVALTNAGYDEATDTWRPLESR